MPENDRIELGKVITNSLHSKGKKVMATIAQALHKEGVNEGILIGKARGEAIGEARGEARGKLEGKLELIKMMLKNGNSVQQISALTGLQVSQIQKLIS